MKYIFLVPNSRNWKKGQKGSKCSHKNWNNWSYSHKIWNNLSHFPHFPIYFQFTTHFLASSFYILWYFVAIYLSCHIKNRITCLNKWKRCKISSLVLLHTHRLCRINTFRSLCKIHFQFFACTGLKKLFLPFPFPICLLYSQTQEKVLR